MRSSPAAVMLLLLLLLGPARNSTAQQSGSSSAEQPLVTLRLRIRPLPEGVRRISLQRNEEGERWFLVERSDGSSERVAAEDLAVLLDPGDVAGSFLFRLLNITSPAGILWVVLGLLGQVLFTGRMILQWLVSEKEKRSVVPVGFWWMSLLGATMLLVYFIWRKDIVGILGQSTGWFIYSRNLWLIYRERRFSARSSSGLAQQ